jgi:hypothetical protein
MNDRHKTSEVSKQIDFFKSCLQQQLETMAWVNQLLYGLQVALRHIYNLPYSIILFIRRQLKNQERYIRWDVDERTTFQIIEETLIGTSRIR